MPLNDRQIRNAKPADKPYRLSDGGNLYLLVKSKGGKYWRLDYAVDGKRKTLAIGTYPTISLVEARQAAEEARRMIAKGADPSEAKQEAKAARKAAALQTFEYLACEWHTANLNRWKPRHAGRIMIDLQRDVFPHIGSKPIDDIAVADIKAVIERIAGRGALSIAEKVRQWIAAVYSYAAMLEITDRNPAAVLRGFVIKRETPHMPALPREELTEFYRRLLLADTDRPNKIAVLLVMLVFVHNTELRGGQWGEIDWKAKTWTIPAERMKRPRAHVVPLSDWAIELLQELHALTGSGVLMFPNRNRTDAFISENTLGKIINTMGYKGIATPHGFRSLASSVLNEQGFNPDAIERQLAHVEGNAIRAAYNRADYMDERTEMMQWYSDFLKERYQAAQNAAK